MGIVSLCGDIIYEGARSVSSPYLLVLCGSAFAVALVAGLGEFLGYGVRIFSGYFADRTQNYWAFTIAGYLMIGAIPLLVFACSWEGAALLLIVERIGKGIRSPPKDAIISHASQGIGRGWGFGIHEALDQIGAVLGPLVFSGSYLIYGGFREGFFLMIFPFALLVTALVIAWRKVPDPAGLEEARARSPLPERFPRIMATYAAFTFFIMAGFLVFPIMAFHFKQYAIVPDALIPVLYAVAMAVDAVVALAIGRAYDRKGMAVLGILPVIALFIPVCAFSQDYFLVVIGMILWGAAMGIQETVLRAAVADFTHISRRGTAYGVLNTVYGGSWFMGSVIVGILYNISIPWLTGFSMVMEIAGLACFVYLKREMGG
jgi:MFS family permease